RLFATLQKQCGFISQKREKGKPSAGLIFKGVVSFFFFVKILINRGGRPGCIHCIKTRIKGRFAQI
ncbi:hypothetical protein, partial [Candidatus Avelusimicrobium sp.]|uniref:hypothetical protein n=1 Tax=Candidatus Avelusimicrobium sp. TaxID=3048833 RepID=UPI003D7E3692